MLVDAPDIVVPTKALIRPWQQWMPEPEGFLTQIFVCRHLIKPIRCINHS